MKQFLQLVVLFAMMAAESSFGATTIATVRSSEAFALNGHSINAPGVTSFPVVIGDTVSTSAGPAVLVFPEGSTIKLGTNSAVRIAGIDANPRIILMGGSLDYKLVQGTSLSVTNKDGEQKQTTPKPLLIASGRQAAPARILPPTNTSKKPVEDNSVINATGGATASYVGSDLTTGGDWKGHYGADGEVIATDTTNVPAYAVASFVGEKASVWDAHSSDPRALQMATDSSGRVASGYAANQFSVDLNLKDGHAHKVSLYLCDFDNQGRQQTVSLIDANSKAVLDTQTFASFATGVYATWNVTGHVQFLVAGNGQRSAVVNGLFFDAPGGVVGAVPVGRSGAAPTARTGGLLTNPRFLIPAAGAGAAGVATGLLALPPVSRHL